jgi:cytosine/adenosine deaminase-related metal-dependent hydrolase
LKSRTRPDFLPGYLPTPQNCEETLYPPSKERSRPESEVRSQLTAALARLFWKDLPRSEDNLIDAGVTPAQIFEMATRSNARALKLDHEIGTVLVGKRANLLLVRADPRKTVQAYAGIVKLILGGRVLDPSTLAAQQ